MNIKEVIEKIERPLLFAAREGCRNIAQVKELESFLKKCVAELKAHPDLRAESMPLVSNLEEAFSGFDGSPAPQKAQCVLNSLRLLDAVKRNTCGIEPTGGALDVNKGGTESISRLSDPVRFLKGVGPKIASLLEKKGVRTVEDLLYYLPRRYEDRRNIGTIAGLKPGCRETFSGTVISSELKRYGRRTLFEATLGDSSGMLLKAKWFYGGHAYLKAAFPPGRRILMTGEVKADFGLKVMLHPDYEPLDEDEVDLGEFKRIIPIYSETEGLNQKKIRKIIRQALNGYAGLLSSPVPPEICRRLGLPALAEAVESAHFPPSEADIDIYNDMASAALRRLVFDDFFYFELGMALRKMSTVLERGISFRTGGKLLEKFYRCLPFELTAAQKRVTSEILSDMEKPFRMSRLLQGDVGCGKTVVAFSAMLIACENGCQAAIMAPTEILANQHFNNIRRWADQLGLKAALVTGSLKGSNRREISAKVADGTVQIVVGTHALVQEGATFRRLGLAVIDEQHRFGVVQRAALCAKGESPDVLFMTATPIPRTLSMTVYADLDLSVIDETPPGKKPVRTRVFMERERERVYGIIRGELRKDSQVFIVYPLVDESEALGLKDATNMAGHLQKEIFQEFRIGLIHGRMKSGEKDRIMSEFSSRQIDILVSTTVIEVGIDVPEASLMVIEHAERFGLSQLHQLRGRVGRGSRPSYCILMTDFAKSEVAARRLKIMEQTSDGFRIAEEDLAIRGPGEFMGTRQSGLPDFRVANILRDARLLNEARREAFALVEADPELKSPEHCRLREVLFTKWGRKLELAKTG